MKWLPIRPRFLRLLKQSLKIRIVPDVDPRLKELAVQQMMETRQAVLYGDFLACDAFDVMERVNKIRVPTLLICGSADRMTPPNRSEYLRDQIEGAQLHILRGQAIWS